MPKRAGTRPRKLQPVDRDSFRQSVDAIRAEREAALRAEMRRRQLSFRAKRERREAGE